MNDHTKTPLMRRERNRRKNYASAVASDPDPWLSSRGIKAKTIAQKMLRNRNASHMFAMSESGVFFGDQMAGHLDGSWNLLAHAHVYIVVVPRELCQRLQLQNKVHMIQMLPFAVYQTQYLLCHFIEPA